MLRLVQDANAMGMQANVYRAQVSHPHKFNKIAKTKKMFRFIFAGLNGERTRVCECKHFTDGPDCEKCLPFYNDAPWGRATSKHVHECKRKSSQSKLNFYFET